jgi:hypothetical protein
LAVLFSSMAPTVFYIQLHSHSLFAKYAYLWGRRRRQIIDVQPTLRPLISAPSRLHLICSSHTALCCVFACVARTSRHFCGCGVPVSRYLGGDLAAPCGTLRHLAAPCGTLRHLAARLRHLAASCGILRHLAAPCGTLRHPAASSSSAHTSITLRFLSI